MQRERRKMNKCRNCGFWKPDSCDYGVCRYLIGALALGERIRFCQIFKKRDKLPIKNAGIVTCADFGCVYFKEKELPDKNCPVCTSFPCWVHQFYTGRVKFCCDKFDRRRPSNCEVYYYCGRNICPCDKWSPKE